MRRERESLLCKIRAYDFALTDVGLFLNTHPTCRSAMNYYRKYKKLYEQAVSDYNARFGPLTSKQVESCECWTWTEAPWPWQMEV